MATLVQITPASRHPPQPYPIVRPSSSSSVPLSQRTQPLYLVSSQPQMYMQQQHHQQAPLMTFDFTRQSHQVQQQVKQAQLSQRRQNQLPPQPNSAPPHPRPQQGMHARSRSDEALRDQSCDQSPIRSSIQVPSTPQAQSAPRPQSAQFRPGTALPSPPPIASGVIRPSSADGFRAPTNIDSHRGRYADQRPRFSPGSNSSREAGGVYMPPSVALGGHHPRYSADDVSTVKSMGSNTHPHQFRPQTSSHHPMQGQYQNVKYQPLPHPHSPSVQSQQFQSSHSLPQPSLHPSHSKPQQSPRAQQSSPLPHIKQRQSSLPLRSDVERVNRVMSPPPRQLKRSSSEPELPPPQTIPAHRKSSSSSSNISAASAPSQLETASSHSSIPPPSLEHVPFTPSPLAKEIEAPTITVILAPETKVKTSLSARLRRALSFSSSSTLSTSASTPDLHAAAQDDEADDTISISSTASSASVMLRKMSQGIKRSRKSIIGIFKGARRRSRVELETGEEQEDKFPFGVPGEEPAVGVSYATVEGEISRESDERRKSMIFSDRDTSLKKKGSKPKFENGSVPRGILKNSDSRQSSFEAQVNVPEPSTIKAALLQESASTAGNTPMVSDFAKSLASTLDSQFNHLATINAVPADEDSTSEEAAYFDIVPPSPTVRQKAVTAPATPTGRSTPRRGIQFSPRLEVHETWHSAEYDRRGEPATCNRLTAQLAQMIKEELNAFKMEEMIVHEVIPRFSLG